MEYSVVIPLFDEEESLVDLDKEIKSTMNKISKNYEIIYIDDGSKDNSLQTLLKLKNIVVINLNRRYGQATALDAGFRAAKGDIVITMDADGQNDPKDIPKLIKKLKDDKLDVVCGWRKKRKDKLEIRNPVH